MKRSPMPRKRATKRRRKPAAKCNVLRCSKRPTVAITETERYCSSHATKIADKLVGDFVKTRDGYRCQLVSFNGKPCVQPEPVFWCHLIPKGRYRSTRWVPDNAVAGCFGHHKLFDDSPVEKDIWCARRLGQDRWDELRRIAIVAKGADVVEVITRYRQEAAA